MSPNIWYIHSQMPEDYTNWKQKCDETGENEWHQTNWQNFLLSSSFTNDQHSMYTSDHFQKVKTNRNSFSIDISISSYRSSSISECYQYQQMYSIRLSAARELSSATAEYTDELNKVSWSLYSSCIIVIIINRNSSTVAAIPSEEYSYHHHKQLQQHQS